MWWLHRVVLHVYVDTLLTLPIWIWGNHFDTKSCVSTCICMCLLQVSFYRASRLLSLPAFRVDQLLFFLWLSIVLRDTFKCDLQMMADFFFTVNFNMVFSGDKTPQEPPTSPVWVSWPGCSYALRLYLQHVYTPAILPAAWRRNWGSQGLDAAAGHLPTGLRGLLNGETAR